VFNPAGGDQIYEIVGLADIIVELAIMFVEDPWQKLVAPENVTVGVSKTLTTNVTGELVPEPFVA
jgi:hypothetical protein